MNDAQIMFEYPVEDMQIIIEEEITEIQNRLKKVKITAFSILSLSLILFLIYSIFSVRIITIIAVILLLFSSFLFSLCIKNERHFLHIRANENEMTLKYFTSKGLKEMQIWYEDISKITFSKDYTSVRIEGKSENTRFKHEILLNNATPEQGFFLYTLPRLTDKTRINSKKIERIFGTQEEFYERMGA